MIIVLAVASATQMRFAPSLDVHARLVISIEKEFVVRTLHLCLN